VSAPRSGSYAKYRVYGGKNMAKREHRGKHSYTTSTAQREHRVYKHSKKITIVSARKIHTVIGAALCITQLYSLHAKYRVKNRCTAQREHRVYKHGVCTAQNT
jgi:hypothetical protein